MELKTVFVIGFSTRFGPVPIIALGFLRFIFGAEILNFDWFLNTRSYNTFAIFQFVLDWILATDRLVLACLLVLAKRYFLGILDTVLDPLLATRLRQLVIFERSATRSET